MITTIACPLTLSHDFVDTQFAPIWEDEMTNKYYVASGVFDQPIEPTEHTQADPEKITIIVGMNGLEALAMMGLTLPGETDE
jgi:hypothetical protein